MWKAEVRTHAFDDSPFTRPDGRVPVVGVHMRGAQQVEGVYMTDVARDGARRAPCGGRRAGARLASASSRAGAPSSCGGGAR